MADGECIEVLKKGVEAWNSWRERNFISSGLSHRHCYDKDIDAAGTPWDHNLVKTWKPSVDLCSYNFENYDLSGANLIGANFSNSNLKNANLSGASLNGSEFDSANLTNANLSGSILSFVDFNHANLERANLNRTTFFETIFRDANLKNVEGLETSRHLGPSTIDHLTISKSEFLPKIFLRGCGLPENFIEYYPSLFNTPFQICSCFISYSSVNEDFAKILHTDLQNDGIRCWFAPHDLRIGD